jgi:hypothetical protein
LVVDERNRRGARGPCSFLIWMWPMGLSRWVDSPIGRPMCGQVVEALRCCARWRAATITATRPLSRITVAAIGTVMSRLLLELASLTGVGGMVQ